MEPDEYFEVCEAVKALAKLRGGLGIGREKIAKVVGVSSVTVRNWEQGKNVPSPLAAKRLDVTIEALREAVRKRCEATLAGRKR